MVRLLESVRPASRAVNPRLNKVASTLGLACLTIVWSASSGVFSVPAHAQAPLAERSQATTGLAGSMEPDPLPGLPRPPDQPNTLYQPAPAGQGYGCCNYECPYFEKDPILDPDCLPHPGWLFDVETDILGTHVFNHVGETDPASGVNGVNVPMATLSAAVSPKFEAGYRLPSGFGEFDVSYRFLLTQGSGALPAGTPASPTAPAALTSRFDMSVGDVDYAATETSLAMLGPNGPLMKWRIGLRTADLLFTSAADETGAGGSHFSISNNYWGIGPHAAVELRTRPNSCGLGLVSKLDGGLLFGKVHQRFFDTAAGSQGDFENWQETPMISGFLGLDWQSKNYPCFDLLLGYTAEYWWNVGRLSDPDLYNGQSAGEVGIQGAVLRLEYNY